MVRQRVLAMCAGSCVALCGSGALGQGCTPLWSHLEGGGLGGAVNALAVFNDGFGPALYAGGAFTSAGHLPVVNRIARWNGESWAALGEGVGGTVNAMAVFDDGSGPALFVGGGFTTAGGLVAMNRIAKWNGQTWSALSTGLNSMVNAMVVHNDGSGNALYVGGLFTTAGGVSIARIARWNGQIWSAVGNGVNSNVNALAVYNDGSGNRLFAAGSFTGSGTQTVTRIARWDGSVWSPLTDSATSLEGVAGTVNALTTFNDGTGNALCVGGAFTSASGVQANRIARWNGQNWSALGAGMANGAVNALGTFNDGNSNALYAGGTFTTAGGLAEGNRIAKWNGQAWSALENGITNSGGSADAMVVFTVDSVPALYVAGTFAGSSGLLAANNIARWRCTPPPPCYANCDGSTTPPVLNIDDFTCFINRFAQGCP